VLAATPLFAGAIMLGSATTASAAASGNSSCLAQAVQGSGGPPGQEQREAHVGSALGQGVAFFAGYPHEDCSDIL
jgi:hypothetical protein